MIYAAKSGQKLLLAKAQCNHGEFKSWLDENCKLSYTNAKNFMQLSSKMPELLNGQTSDHLKLSQAISLLNAPENVKVEVLEKIESGEDVTIKEIQRLKKEAADLLAEKQAVQNDLIGAKQAIEETQKRVNFLVDDRDAFRKQNDELRNRDQSLIDAKSAI